MTPSWRSLLTTCFAQKLDSVLLGMSHERMGGVEDNAHNKKKDVLSLSAGQPGFPGYVFWTRIRGWWWLDGGFEERVVHATPLISTHLASLSKLFLAGLSSSVVPQLPLLF